MSTLSDVQNKKGGTQWDTQFRIYTQFQKSKTPYYLPRIIPTLDESYICFITSIGSQQHSIHAESFLRLRTEEKAIVLLPILCKWHSNPSVRMDSNRTTKATTMQTMPMYSSYCPTTWFQCIWRLACKIRFSVHVYRKNDTRQLLHSSRSVAFICWPFIHCSLQANLKLSATHTYIYIYISHVTFRLHTHTLNHDVHTIKTILHNN